MNTHSYTSDALIFSFVGGKRKKQRDRKKKEHMFTHFLFFFYIYKFPLLQAVPEEVMTSLKWNQDHKLDSQITFQLLCSSESALMQEVILS